MEIFLDNKMIAIGEKGFIYECSLNNNEIIKQHNMNIEN